LLTDYSSCAGDFVITKKPVILTVFDSEEYQQNCRSFRYPLEDTGFVLAHNQTELENIIFSLSEDKINSHCDKVMDFFGITESGHSAENVCKEIHSFYRSHFKK
jgi:CDP-glycerol glycerophosphotransferase